MTENMIIIDSPDIMDHAGNNEATQQEKEEKQKQEESLRTRITGKIRIPNPR